MLQHTFIHIQGIGPKTEQSFWRRGLYTWEDFLGHSGGVLSKPRERIVRRGLEESVANIGNVRFFADRLKSADAWRLFGGFRERAVYLDIETAHEAPEAGEITVIGLYDGKRVQTFVNGVNLADFEVAVAEYDLVITFNGGPFDLPVIRHAFPGITLPPAHIDLRFVLKRLGYSGGLKRIEKATGLVRDDGIDGLDGWDAVRLWWDHCNGDSSALERLVAYNTADIVNLEPLMEMAYRRLQFSLLPDLYAE